MQADETLLTPIQAATLLNLPVRRITDRSWRDKFAVPTRRCGHHLRFAKSELLEWSRRGRPRHVEAA
jgi:hypothetical protein